MPTPPYVEPSLQVSSAPPQETEAQWRTVLAALDKGIALYDARGAVLFVNAAAERLLGLTFEQLQDRAEIDPRWRALREDGTDYPRGEHPHWVALHTGAPATAVMVTAAPDRAPVWVAVRAQPLFEGDTGKPTGAVASFTDITERRALDLALRESEERLRQTLAVTGAGTFSLRFTEGVMHFDTQMWALSGAPRPAGDLTLASATAFVHPDDRARVQAVIVGALEPNGPTSVVYAPPGARAAPLAVGARGSSAGCGRARAGRPEKVSKDLFRYLASYESSDTLPDTLPPFLGTPFLGRPGTGGRVSLTASEAGAARGLAITS